ncbi:MULTISPECIES: ABC transporter ATP-binding protein [unclassified Microcoleus]|uniref:ABC transporter ATP-binding protein n=1 Tax=unclassified Microcoleus TaxID=2642155 RepID=UPI002FCFA4B4
MRFLNFVRVINKYIAPYRWLAIFLCSSQIFEAAFESAMRISFKFIIDAAIVPQNYSLLVWILLLLGGGAIVFIVVGLLGDFLSAQLGILLLNNIRCSLFERIQNLSMEFFGRRSAGDIINCFQADAEKVENSFILGLPVVIFCLSNILFSVIFLFSLNWQLAVLSCIGLTFCAIAPANVARRATKEGYHLRQKEGHIASVIEENLLSQPVVKIFGLEKRVSKDFSAQLNDLKRVYVRAKFLSSLVQRIPSLAFVLVQLVILSISAVMTYRNWISVGTLVSYQVLLIGLHSTILNFTWGLPYLIDGVTGLQRINDILAEIPEVQEAPGAIDLPHFQSDIYFDNVSFSYSKDRGGVKNLSLKIRQGDFAVFVGQSGAGKSTIVNLLTRFYDPDKGRILLDGVDLRDCTIRSLRSQIGLVSQEVILFNGSVRENIRMGYLEASDEEVEAAAKAAEIHNFILTLPQGYDTPVGDRGGQLSGGQRQRIALARALVRNPAILILDEATSALDPATEVEIMTTLERIAQKCTVIVITHKMAHALRADVMFVMDKGCLVVSG